jgi:hypothetical protein
MKEAVPERLIATAKAVEIRGRDAPVAPSDEQHSRRFFSKFLNRRDA